MKIPKTPLALIPSSSACMRSRRTADKEGVGDRRESWHSVARIIVGDADRVVGGPDQVSGQVDRALIGRADQSAEPGQQRDGISLFGEAPDHPGQRHDRGEGGPDGEEVKPEDIGGHPTAIVAPRNLSNFRGSVRES